MRRYETLKGGETMTRHNLYMFRCANKLTRGKMATKTGVSRTTYSLIESGKRDGSHAFWGSLQREFGVPDEQMYSLMKTEEREEQCETKEN